MPNQIFYRFGSNTSCNIVGVCTEGAKHITTKDGQKRTRLVLTTRQTYTQGEEQRTTEQRVTVFQIGHLDVPAGAVVSVEGKIGVAVVSPASDSQKYPISQLVIREAQTEVICSQAAEGFLGMNAATLTGTIGSVREITRKNGGDPMVAVSLAVDRNVNKQSETDWHEILLFGHNAENAKKYLGKGDVVLFSGRLNLRSTKVNGADRELLAFAATGYNTMHRKTAGAASKPAAGNTEPKPYDDITMI